MSSLSGWEEGCRWRLGMANQCFTRRSRRAWEDLPPRSHGTGGGGRLCLLQRRTRHPQHPRGWRHERLPLRHGLSKFTVKYLIRLNGSIRLVLSGGAGLAPSPL